MNGLKVTQRLTILFISAVGGLSFQTASAQTKKKTVKYHTVPSGQTLRERIEDSIRSKTTPSGNTFRPVNDCPGLFKRRNRIDSRRKHGEQQVWADMLITPSFGNGIFVEVDIIEKTLLKRQ